MLRVKKYLLTCDTTSFTKIAHLIDPEDELQKAFHTLYDEVTQERINNKEKSMGTGNDNKKRTCAIF